MQVEVTNIYEDTYLMLVEITNNNACFRSN